METKELLEQLVKEVAVQNKLIALIVSTKLGIENFGMFDDERKIKELFKFAKIIHYSVLSQNQMNAQKVEGAP